MSFVEFFPDEISRHIFTTIKPSGLFLTRLVCKSWNEFNIIIKESGTLHYLIKKEYISTAKWALSQGVKTYPHCMSHAIMYGDIELFDLLADRVYVDEYILNFAAKEGNLNIMKRLVQKYSILPTGNTLFNCITSGNTEALKYILEISSMGYIVPSHRIIDCFRSGRFDILDILLKSTCKINVDDFRIMWQRAVHDNFIPGLKWLKENNFDNSILDQLTIGTYDGCLPETLQWLYDNGKIFGDKDLKFALYNHNIQAFGWLLEKIQLNSP